MVNDVEFIVNYSRTLDAVHRFATNNKVKFFGNLTSVLPSTARIIYNKSTKGAV